MKTLTREQYLSQFRKEAALVNSTKTSAISFYNEIGVLTPTGRVSKNYKLASPKPPRRP